MKINKVVVSGALLIFLPAIAFSETKFSGFADVVYQVSDGLTDGTSATEGRFDISGEIDFESDINANSKVRVDLDLFAQSFQSGIDFDRNGTFELANPVEGEASLEQAFIAWNTQAGVGLKGGLFNNPVGWEAEDATGLYQISHGLIYTFLDASTLEYGGNNLAGFGVSGGAEGLHVFGGIANDLAGVAEESTLFGVAQYSADPSLEVEVGLLTQESNLENLFDINATFRQGPLTVGGEIFTASEIVDMGFGLTGNYQATRKVSGTLRYENISFDGDNVDDWSSIVLAGAYALAPNMAVNAEINFLDFGGDEDGEIISLELIATFD